MSTPLASVPQLPGTPASPAGAPDGGPHGDRPGGGGRRAPRALSLAQVGAALPAAVRKLDPRVR
jgi:K+-transporting ATPase ATPase B chain